MSSRTTPQSEEYEKTTLGGPEYDDYEEDYDMDDDIDADLEGLHLSFAPLKLRLKSTTAEAPSTTKSHLDVPNSTASTASEPVLAVSPLNEKKRDLPVLIVPGLYLGSEAHAKRGWELTELGVTHILTIHEKAKAHYPHDFEYLTIPIRDRQDVNISNHFKEAHQFIRKAHEASGIVLVHCWAGMSRSASIVISYLMQREQISYAAAFKIVFEAKPDIHPNSGFIFQMQQFQKQIGIAEIERKATHHYASKSAPKNNASSSNSFPKKSGKASNRRKRDR